MAKKYLLLYVNVLGGKNPSTPIEEKLNKHEWARLRGGDVYIVYTDLDPIGLRKLIQPVLGEDSHILVSEFSMGNHSGFLLSSTVEWINKKRGE